MKNSESAPPAQGRTNSSLRILVVDDEIYIRELLVKTLGRLGYENVDAAYDGADAWQALHEVSYDLVITDYKMPMVTGLELIAQMRYEGMRQPVILISGTLPTEEIDRNPSLRVDAMLPKPFTVATLSATIEKLLRAHESPAVALARGQKNSSRRILVVDDDHDSRQLQIDLLTSSGYKVEFANDGATGWEALRTYEYDLVVTDNHMPNMTGLEMIEKLHVSGMTVPVIMQAGRKITRHHMVIVDLAESSWDWQQAGEPPMDNPAYYLRYCKTFSRMGGTMRYVCSHNRDFLLTLLQELQK